MIPDYQTLMLPVLKACAHGEVVTRELIGVLADELKLSPEEKSEILPSGKRARFDNRVEWAKTYLKQAGLLTYPSRGRLKITKSGQKVIADDPETINIKYLMQFESFVEFRNRKGTAYGNRKEVEESLNADLTATPDEILRAAHKTIKDALATDLLDLVRSATPLFFEELIIGLLEAMGYGGATSDSGRALGRSGDDGVDGVIDQDPLGVDQIYVQAKRYAEGNSIGAGAIRDFFGALNLKKAQKGIFFTTSAFSPPAEKTATDLGMRIVLIDGRRLANLMIRYNIGCRDEEILHLKKIDEEFFE